MLLWERYLKYVLLMNTRLLCKLFFLHPSELEKRICLFSLSEILLFFKDKDYFSFHLLPLEKNKRMLDLPKYNYRQRPCAEFLFWWWMTSPSHLGTWNDEIFYTSHGNWSPKKSHYCISQVELGCVAVITKFYNHDGFTQQKSILSIREIYCGLLWMLFYLETQRSKLSSSYNTATLICFS